MNNTPWLVFTDLDGTLLDHHDYSFAAAAPALARLAELHIPVIINSSKTLAELRTIADALALDAPVVAENGSLIATKDNPVQVLGQRYQSICECLNELRDSEGFKFAGFQDWDIKQVADVTGLNLGAAAQAKQRQASEPIIWDDTDANLERFKALLAAQGLTVKRGGRFWHIMGETDKVKAMQALVGRYTTPQCTPRVLALGDGPNDVEMLSAADVAVIVNNPDGRAIAVPCRAGQQVIRTELPGPSGWNQTVLQLLSQAALS